MEYKKKNGFLAFCFSFIPGAAEMYMGFMKNGLSIMVSFAVIVSVFYYSGLDGLASLAIAVWLFAIVHAWKMRKLCKNTTEKIEDRLVFEELKEGTCLIELAVAMVIAGLLDIGGDVALFAHIKNLRGEDLMSSLIQQKIFDMGTSIFMIVVGIVLFFAEKKSKKLVKTLEYK